MAGASAGVAGRIELIQWFTRALRNHYAAFLHRRFEPQAHAHRETLEQEPAWAPYSVLLEIADKELCWPSVV